MGGREAKACFVSRVFGCAALLRAGARVPGAGDGAGAFGLPGAIERFKTGAPDGYRNLGCSAFGGRTAAREADIALLWIYIILIE